MGRYAIFLKLQGRRVVIIGGGNVARRKAESLLEAGARLVVVADAIDPTFEDLCRGKNVEIIRSKYSKDYLNCSSLVIAATDDHPLNQQIYKDCQQLETLCNVVDEPELCDFYVPAVVKRGDLVIAIGTDGMCPAYSGHIRKILEEVITEEHGKFLDQLKCARQRVIEKITDMDTRKALLGKLVSEESFEYYKQNGSAIWNSRADQIIEEQQI
ncbi:MAG TPA: bifunctional precorrin-2 dehydrogenase/sirohydrochlorin ferrochelatase [Sedimentisphaerales bacterium]|nr:bifunctional precorrin-2 dehydrogenase/sirohydrochlorin ferrochelatase [Sedimentisphaerales bacterium]